MRYIFVLLALTVCVACTTPSYPSGIDTPKPITELDKRVIDYIDRRLEQEYYWLDEVIERGGSFNRNVEWERYLGSSLGLLTTNADDGYINSKGARVLYSYIRELEGDTRTKSQTMGFGIDLHYTIVKIGDSAYGFVVENIYEGSPAAEADVRRGDIITSIDGNYINQSNYQTLFNTIQFSSASQVGLELHRQTAASEQDKSHTATLTRAGYYTSPVAYCTVLDIEGVERRIGYLVYTAFDSNYNEELEAALAMLATEGIDDLILDLRCNNGGSVASATLLCSAIMGNAREGELLFELRRNPKNIVDNSSSFCLVEPTTASLGLDKITVICSHYSASASEMVVVGLRGAGLPVTLIGRTTEGKNCGMDVTRCTIGDIYLEYAPITFMCYNSEGFGGYGEGIIPDVDLTTENSYGVSDEFYPLPRTSWGDVSHDIGLATAVASITGKKIAQSETSTRAFAARCEASELTMPREFVGTRMYRD